MNLKQLQSKEVHGVNITGDWPWDYQNITAVMLVMLHDHLSDNDTINRWYHLMLDRARFWCHTPALGGRHKQKAQRYKRWFLYENPDTSQTAMLKHWGLA